MLCPKKVTLQLHVKARFIVPPLVTCNDGLLDKRDSLYAHESDQSMVVLIVYVIG